MTNLLPPVSPTPDDVRLAKQSGRKLASIARSKSSRLRLRVATPHKNPETVDLPAAALRLLIEILSEMGRGNAVTLVPIQARLTTRQAAEILGVSRPFLIKQINAGELRCQKVGTHRRIRYRDLLAYHAKMQSQHDDAMEDLVRQAQEQGMGY
jgi:excisionase family DNA binding protein